MSKVFLGYVFVEVQCFGVSAFRVVAPRRRIEWVPVLAPVRLDGSGGVDVLLENR